nr:hypothetical protein [Xaviernesmea rhizosphaerae]
MKRRGGDTHRRRHGEDAIEDKARFARRPVKRDLLAQRQHDAADIGGMIAVAILQQRSIDEDGLCFQVAGAHRHLAKRVADGERRESQRLDPRPLHHARRAIRHVGEPHELARRHELHDIRRLKPQQAWRQCETDALARRAFRHHSAGAN